LAALRRHDATDADNGERAQCIHATQPALNDKPDDNSNRLLRLDEEPDTDADRPEIDVAKEAQQAQSPVAGGDVEEHIPWSPTPPPRNRSPGPSVINHKCKHSNISSGNTSINSTISKKGRRDVSSRGAFVGLRDELSTFSNTFLDGIALAKAPPTTTLAPSPLRKTKAIMRAQELEEDLDDEKLAALIWIFQSDVNAADAYMVIKQPGLRKAWIENTLPSI
jgi:hypothetical protein